MSPYWGRAIPIENFRALFPAAECVTLSIICGSVDGRVGISLYRRGPARISQSPGADIQPAFAGYSLIPYDDLVRLRFLIV